MSRSLLSCFLCITAFVFAFTSCTQLNGIGDELPYTDITTESETTTGMQYEYTPSLGSIDQLSEVGVTIGDVTVEAQKHVSAVYSCIGKDEATGEFIYSTLGEGIIFFEKSIFR